MKRKQKLIGDKIITQKKELLQLQTPFLIVFDSKSSIFHWEKCYICVRSVTE